MPATSYFPVVVRPGATSAEPTIDAAALRLKTRSESAQTLRLSRRIDAGFLTHPRFFYGVYALLIVTLVGHLLWGTGALLLLLFADWVVYRRRRGRVLRLYRDNPIRLRNVADFMAVDRLYEREGVPQPTMDDCVRLGWEDSGGRAVPEEQWRPQAAERYLDILNVYRAFPMPPAVVVDVGTSDGQACWDFGVGRDSTLIGIEISHLLLKRFKEHLPHQIPLQADGASLPLRSASVDFLFCTETLEHLTDPQKAIDEFLRVLRPGGIMMIQSPNAHRLRNLNLFELLMLPVGILTDRVLQKKVVHANTWHNASSYHWDFSMQDYYRMLAGRPARIIEMYSREFFCPQVLLGSSIRRFRIKERLYRSLPLLRFSGGDLAMVVRKEAGATPRA
jgi:ubiquinone/menaquinone biosynthesis C-methylase UbiE